MSHWSSILADKIIEKNPNKEEYVCAAGISPSGSVHIGNFRDVATSLFVVKALQQKGKKAKLLLSWDDFDRLRKVPSNIKEIASDFEKNIGKPYSFIEDPIQTDKSYAAHFEHEFEKSLREMGIEVDIRRQTEYYTSGKYRDQIKLAMSCRKEIYDIIMSFKTQDSSEKEKENYYPISIYCDKTKKDNTEIVSYDEKTGELVFFCKDCNENHTVNINKYDLIKLVWKVDWPMRWKYEGVDFEPGGIDHASMNGSYDVATVIAKNIFGYDAPIFQGYGWLGIKGIGSMHSSTGNSITPARILDIYEPEMVKWLFAKYRPEDSFDFAFDDTVNRHYSEYDKLVASAKNGTATENEQELINLIFDGNKDFKEKVAFGSIAGLAPIVDFNPHILAKAFAKVGVTFDANSLDRLEKVKIWLNVYNPDKLYVPLKEFNYKYYDAMSKEEKEIVNSLCKFIKNNDFDDKQVQQFLYSIINDPNLSKKENVERQKQNFKNFYNLIFGTDQGPKLYLFLAAADKNKYIKLLDNDKKKILDYIMQM